MEQREEFVGASLLLQNFTQAYTKRPIAGLRPVIGHHGFINKEVVFFRRQTPDNRRQINRFRISVDLIGLGLMQLQLTPGQPMSEVREYAGDLLEHGTGAAFMRVVDEALDIGDHLTRGVQPLLVVDIHGVQQPGLDDLLIDLRHRVDDIGNKLISQLDIETGDALHPIQDKVLIVTRQLRNDARGFLGFQKGKLDIQMFIEKQDDLIGCKGC